MLKELSGADKGMLVLKSSQEVVFNTSSSSDILRSS